MWPMLASHSRSSCLNLRMAGVTHMPPHLAKHYYSLGLSPGPLSSMKAAKALEALQDSSPSPSRLIPSA
jgi:hypothetical protein